MFCLLVVQLHAQKKTVRSIQIKHADSWSFDSDKNNAQVLKGNVVCEHDGTFLYCDTALVYDKETRMVASGHILITKGDSIRVTGQTLVYDGKTKMAVLQNNVKCVEKDMTLTTDYLTFDVGRSVANYYNGGKIVNKENTLVSKNGHYYSAGKEAAFHYDVELTNPDYKMTSDTLRYKMTNKTAYFLGPSLITSKTDYIYCENGWYDTEKEISQFSKNALLVTEQQKLRGDSLVYDRVSKTGIAYGNVTLVDTSQKSLIFGDFIRYKQDKSEALITKKALYARIIEADTLFIAADTLYHTDIDSVDNFLNAYHHVRIFKKDLQAACDSSSMNTRDSILELFGSPFIWGKLMQATSRIMKIHLNKKELKGFTLDGKALLINQVDSLHPNMFNQLLGRTITGTITQDTIRKVVVSGNAEMLYFPKNNKSFVGLNRTTGTEIHMWFKQGEASRVTIRSKTEGTVDPIKDVDLTNARLKGFNWQYEKRPKSRFELHEPAGNEKKIR